MCAKPAEQMHHLCYRQHVRKHGGDVDDPRNLMALCYDHHRRHHNRLAPIHRDLLPDVAVEFMEELMGEAAQDYIARYYQGGEQ